MGTTTITSTRFSPYILFYHPNKEDNNPYCKEGEEKGPGIRIDQVKHLPDTL